MENNVLAQHFSDDDIRSIVYGCIIPITDAMESTSENKQFIFKSAEILKEKNIDYVVLQNKNTKRISLWRAEDLSDENLFRLNEVIEKELKNNGKKKIKTSEYFAKCKNDKLVLVPARDKFHKEIKNKQKQWRRGNINAIMIFKDKKTYGGL